jgi:hypothetical protein
MEKLSVPNFVSFVYRPRRSSAKRPRCPYSLTGVGQYWISNRVWAGAGLGLGENDLEVGRFTVRSGNSFAASAQAGVEL